MSVQEARHGTAGGYRDDGCKCDKCKKAIALNHNLYKMRRAANGGRPLLVSKIGAVRRLQALMALGWPRRELARCAGYQGDAFALVLNGQRQTVTLATHQRIGDLYDRLCMTPGPSSSTRIRAQKKGWPPPLAWDDIDNDFINASPEMVEKDCQSFSEVDEVIVLRVMQGDTTIAKTATPAERSAIAQRWRALGRPVNELARLTGWKPERYYRASA